MSQLVRQHPLARELEECLWARYWGQQEYGIRRLITLANMIVDEDYVEKKVETYPSWQDQDDTDYSVGDCYPHDIWRFRE